MTDRITAEEYRAMIEGNRSAGNRKVHGATKVERDGIVFDSKIESYMHSLLTLHKIRFEFQKAYVLQPAFEYDGQTVRAITYTVDFALLDYDVVIDTKGVLTQQGALRIKMLKKMFADAGLRTRIELPRTCDECAALVRKIIEHGK